MIFLVSCVKSRGAERRYYLVNASEAREAGSGLMLDSGEVVDAVIEDDAVGSFALADNPERFKADIGKSFDSVIDKSMMDKPYVHGNKELDSVTAKMHGKLESAARLLLRKLLYCAPIIVRYHNDADGLSGASVLRNAIVDFSRKGNVASESNTIWVMNKGVAYSGYEAGYDVMVTNNYSSIEKPLLIIIDFGTSVDSDSGIDALSGKFDIIWLDHHPVNGSMKCKDLKNYINPWLHGGDSSYTGGFLSAAFARTFSGIDVGMLADISLIGDHSAFAKDDKKIASIAEVLDLLTSDPHVALGSSGDEVTPQKLAQLLNDKEKMQELSSYANSRLTEALDAAAGYVKIYKAGKYTVHVIDFEDIKSDMTRYPLPGRFSSKLLDKVGDDACVIVHGGTYFSIRVGANLCEKLQLLDVIKDLREKYSDLVEAGGGHMCAASIKVRDQNEKKAVLKLLVEQIKKKLEP